MLHKLCNKVLRNKLVSNLLTFLKCWMKDREQKSKGQIYCRINEIPIFYDEEILSFDFMMIIFEK